jgi:uncharacterized metal-binding protein YceD (DUF177 family)
VIIDLARLSDEGERFTGEESSDILQLGEDASVQMLEGIHFDLTAVRVDRELLVRGRIWTKAVCLCTRCGTPASHEVEDSRFVESYELAEGAEFLDLTTDIRESILLSFPTYPLCGVGCKGLCPQCGANWNRRRCRCKEPSDNRWSALDGLRME